MTALPAPTPQPNHGDAEAACSNGGHYVMFVVDTTNAARGASGDLWVGRVTLER